MDMLKYLNSRDIAEYLESINFEFNAMQAAYIVYINDWLTIKDRIRLWREIVETMPDCEYRYLSEGLMCIMPSAHTAIMEHVEKIEELLAAFESSEFDKDEIVYIPQASSWGCPDWCKVLSREYEAIGGVLWYPHRLGGAFRSFEKCVRRLKDNLHECGNLEPARPSGSFERYRIRLGYLDSDCVNCHSEGHKSRLSDLLLGEVVLNGDFEIIEFAVGWSSEAFEGFVPGIPHPFEGGDIVINASSAGVLPFVFDRCVTWTIEDGPHADWEDIFDSNPGGETEAECGKPLLWRSVTIDDFSGAVKRRGSRFGFSDVLDYGHGHMFVCGYTLDVGDPGSILEYCPFVCDSFLNLEYFRGPFEGRLSILPTVSWFVMNEERGSCNFEASYEREEKAVEKFRSRNIAIPDAAPYDICSLVNEGFRLG